MSCCFLGFIHTSLSLHFLEKNRESLWFANYLFFSKATKRSSPKNTRTTSERIPPMDATTTTLVPSSSSHDVTTLGASFVTPTLDNLDGGGGGDDDGMFELDWMLEGLADFPYD